MKNKLKSRKLWLAITTNVIGIGTALAGSNNADLVIVGIIIAAAGNIVYMAVEGVIDAKSVVNTVATSAEVISETLSKEKK